MKNYTVRFALSMIVIILPILTIIHGIILFIHTLKQEFSMNVLGKELLVLGISLIYLVTNFFMDLFIVVEFRFLRFVLQISGKSSGCGNL